MIIRRLCQLLVVFKELGNQCFIRVSFTKEHELVSTGVSTGKYTVISVDVGVNNRVDVIVRDVGGCRRVAGCAAYVKYNYLTTTTNNILKG